MQKLIAGIHKFQKEELGRYQALFRRLSREGQNPSTLFITCSDSRVIAELITQSNPGDLFVIKNVGNIVPRADEKEKTNSTAAAIEFAVESLGVSDIVVCGHSQCGAMSALLYGMENEQKMPHLGTWLKVALPVKEVIDHNYEHLIDPNARITAAAEENVLYAMENLHTYPIVIEKLAAGTLRLHGWFFHIATGKMFAYDPTVQQFQPLECS